MNMDFLQGLENFDQVWRRVRGEPAPTGSTNGESGGDCSGDSDAVSALLRSRIDAKCAQAFYYTQAAKCCRSGNLAAELLRLSGEERRHLRCLQLEYFLRTGCCHRPAPACPRLDTPLQNLRMAWLGEQASAEQFRADAANCPSELCPVFSHIAQADDCHCAVLRKWIRKAIVG